MDLSVPIFWRNNKERYNLLAGKCLDCKKVFIPLRKNCIECGKDKIEIKNLSTR